MYDAGGKLLVCARVKWGESEHFRIESGVMKGCVISPWLFNVYMERSENGDGEDGSEISGEEEGVEFVWPLLFR